YSGTARSSITRAVSSSSSRSLIMASSWCARSERMGVVDSLRSVYRSGSSIVLSLHPHRPRALDPQQVLGNDCKSPLRDHHRRSDSRPIGNQPFPTTADTGFRPPLVALLGAVLWVLLGWREPAGQSPTEVAAGGCKPARWGVRADTL